jgi:hypothetical protein
MLVTLANLSVIPENYEPTADVLERSNALRDRLINMGERIQEIHKSQWIIIKAFKDDPQLCWAQGYKDHYEFCCDPEIAIALWGREINGTQTADRMCEKIDLQLKLTEDDDLDLFKELKPSVSSTGIMPKIKTMVDLLPPPENKEERKAAVDTLKQEIRRISAQTWVESRNEAREHRRAYMDYDSATGVVYYNPIRGERQAVLRLNANAGELAAEVLHKLIAPKYESATMKDGEITLWQKGQAFHVADVLTQNENALSMVSNALQAKRA